MRALADVSVVIPAYNASLYIGEAIESCLGQTVPIREIIVVDDGSTDDTSGAVARFGSRVRLVTQANRGEGGARNRGIEEAHSSWIAFLDADDVWEPSKVEEQLAFCNRDDIVGCHTCFRSFGFHTNYADVGSVPEEIRYSVPHILLHAPVLPSSLMVRRGLRIRFPEWATAAVDVMYGVELARQGKVALVRKPLVRYRRHSRSMSSQQRFLLSAHECTLQWLDRNEALVSESDRLAVRDGMFVRLFALANQLRWQRRWQELDQLQSFLRRYAEHPQVAAFVTKRDWPRWTYWLKDRARALQTGSL